MHGLLGELQPDPQRTKLMSSAWCLIHSRAWRTSYSAQQDVHLR